MIEGHLLYFMNQQEIRPLIAIVSLKDIHISDTFQMKSKQFYE